MFRVISFLLIFFLLFISNTYAENQVVNSRAYLITVTNPKLGLTDPIMKITGAAYFSKVSKVASYTAGKVIQVKVNEGDNIKKGDILAILDTSLLKYSLDSAIAATKQAEEGLVKAKRDYNRSKILFEKHSISELKFLDDSTAFNNAKLEYSAKLANQRRLENEIEKMTIRAPFDGSIISKDIEEGEWVSSGGIVATVATLSYEAKIYVPERVLPFLNVGQKINLSSRDKDYIGKILSVNSKGDIATRLFLVRIELGKDSLLKEGILLTALIPSGKPINAFMVLHDAVIEKNGVKGIFRINNEDKAIFIPIEIIGYNGNLLAIKPTNDITLHESDRIALAGNNLLNNGVKVNIGKKVE